MIDKEKRKPQSSGGSNIQTNTPVGVGLIAACKPESISDNKETNSNKKAHYGEYVIWFLIGIGLLVIPVWRVSREFFDTHSGMVSAFGTIAIMLLTIMYVRYSRHQWRVMDGQLQQMRQQLPELQKSAQAARNSADALVAAERAWIMVNLDWCDNLRIFVTTRQDGRKITGINIECICTNQGRTPAWITEIKCVLKFSGLDLEPEPTFDHVEPYHSEPEPIPSGKDSKPYKLQPGCEGEQGNQILIFYGIVNYRDMFGFDRYTTFGYVIGNDLGRTIKRISGYPRYNWNA